jgi:hypothetical protein
MDRSNQNGRVTTLEALLVVEQQARLMLHQPMTPGDREVVRRVLAEVLALRLFLQ